MWERGYRHNPLSYRYRYYFDNRPILPQDETMNWMPLRGKSSDAYHLIYLSFIHAKAKKTMLLNNMPANDRENLKAFMNYYEKFFANLKTLSYIPSFFMAGALFKLWRPRTKILYPVSFVGIVLLNQSIISSYFKSYANNYIGYFYHKYAHLAVDKFENIEDPRRKFFRLDTTSYYRQSHDDILHKGHDGDHHDHEAPYYGTSPVSLNY
jgi:hypothetical protein